jgi:hypothetical protein
MANFKATKSLDAGEANLSELIDFIDTVKLMVDGSEALYDNVEVELNVDDALELRWSA